MTTQSNSTTHDRIDALKAEVESVVETVKTRAASLGDKASEMKTSAVESTTAFISKATTLIKEHPIAATGIAFGAGYLVMRLLRR